MKTFVPIIVWFLLASPTSAQAAETNDDIAKNTAFLAANPKFLDAIGVLITRNGYECPQVIHLWTKGISPLGLRLEALCGPRGSTGAYPTLHYSVYPDRLKVIVCKPFDAFGGGCE